MKDRCIRRDPISNMHQRIAIFGKHNRRLSHPAKHPRESFELRFAASNEGCRLFDPDQQSALSPRIAKRRNGPRWRIVGCFEFASGVSERQPELEKVVSARRTQTTEAMLDR